MKRISAILLACICTTISIKAFTVVDASSGDPVVAASVFDARGAILGITDEKGNLATDATTRFPLSIRCVGYTNAEARSAADDVILMDFCSYQLPEASVTSDRDGVRVICYMREYATLITDKDTTISFSEGMADVVLPLRPQSKGFKGWNSPRTLTTKTYNRIIHCDGSPDSLDSKNHNFFIAPILKFPPNEFQEPDELVNRETGRDTTYNKKMMREMRKTPSTFSVNIDGLANEENHTYSPNSLKLLGFTCDINELYMTANYYRNGTSKYHTHDLFQMGFSVRAVLRGKMFKAIFNTKQPIDLKMRVEAYPVDFEYLTLEECKQAHKERKTIPATEIHLPANVPPLDPVTLRLVEQVNALPKE